MIGTGVHLLASERSERDTLRSVQLRIADILYIIYTVFARSVAAATNVFNLSQREATIQERLLFESGIYLFDCALPQELNDYVMVFVNV